MLTFQHSDLVASIKAVMDPHGTVIMAYSHHIPGLEEQDDAFFASARDAGFTVTKNTHLVGHHMWSAGKTADIYIVEMKLAIDF
jgi:hypothetical protein